MSYPDIAVINFSSGISDAEAQHVIRSINRQVFEDFMPIWGSAYQCKLHASPFLPDSPDEIQEDPVQAEAVIYLVDDGTIPNALGYHDINAQEVPVGFVFTDLGDWTVTLSHETLELIVDPTVNIFVPGPDPRDPENTDKWLLHTYEVCDAVERTQYNIDGIAVSNFITPQYFSEGNAAGTRNDFLGTGVSSFGLLPGCHLGTVDPANGFAWVTILANQTPKGDLTARAELYANPKGGERPRPDAHQEAFLNAYRSRAAALNRPGLKQVPAITRSNRKKLYWEAHGTHKGALGENH